VKVPEGMLVCDSHGLIVEYLPSCTGECPRPEEIVGNSLFENVFDSSEIPGLVEAFRLSVESRGGGKYTSLRLDLNRGGISTRYLFGIIPSPLPGRVFLSIAALAHPDLPMTAWLRQDRIHGKLNDAAGLRVLVANADFWKALEAVSEGLGEEYLREMGAFWARGHTIRVDAFVQRKTLKALRELDLETALEYISASLSVIGLGRFETSFVHRQKGLVIVDHDHSPFVEILTGRDHCCRILEGFHSGLFSYLSGRNLDARELCCVAGGYSFCRFLVGSPERLEGLRGPSAEAEKALIDQLKEEVR